METMEQKVSPPVADGVVRYDEASPSGLVWAVTRGPCAEAGSRAGYHTGWDKRWQVRYKKKMYSVHRLIYELHHGPIPADRFIDHIDGNPQNNRIDNLRVATHAENTRNQKVQKRNPYGVRGLSRRKDGGWYGTVSFNRKQYHKYSRDRSVVEAWLIDVRSKLHGAFARHE